MKTKKMVVWLLLCVCSVNAADRFVATNSPDPGAPYTNWTTASHTVAAAVSLANAADAGETVWVSNGVHTVANLQIQNTIVRGYSGNPADVILDAGGTTRGVDLWHAGAQLLDVTVCNGLADNGGGIRFYFCDALASNCIIRNNHGTYSGGGVYLNPGRLFDSQVVSNTLDSSFNGGAGVCNSGGVVSNCVIRHNTAVYYAGGVILGVKGGVFDSVIVSNTAGSGLAGGIYMSGASSIVANCVIGWNEAETYGGGIYMLGATSLVQNCLIVGNRSITTNGGGLYFGAGIGSVLESSTIVGNGASYAGGGLHAQPAAYTVPVTNCIIYNNTAGQSGTEDISVRYANMTNAYFFCCSSRGLPVAQGNITAPPLFVEAAAGNYHLRSGSPCINTGTNHVWMTNAADLDGRPRLDRFNRLVDMGCYEHVPVGTMFGLR